MVDKSPWCIQLKSVQGDKPKGKRKRQARILDEQTQHKRSRYGKMFEIPKTWTRQEAHVLTRSKNTSSVQNGKHQQESKANFGTLSVTTKSIPEEVKEEILLRLPVKSLARFCCVSKSWNNLISSENFISLHLKRQTSHLLVGTCCCLGREPLISILSLGSQTALQKVVNLEIPESINACHRIVSGSCNGIICLHGTCADRIVLWNPAMKDVKRIPPSNIPRQQGRLAFCEVGLGFDPKRNDYKVLQVVYHSITSIRECVQLELYSLRSNSWRKVDSHGHVCEPTATYDAMRSLPFTENRVLCGLASPLKGPNKWEVISFDMTTETLEVIRLCPTLHDDLASCSYFILFPFKESIAIGVCHRVLGQSLCDIWELNDFFSTQSRSWSKLFSTKLHNGPAAIGSWGNRILFKGFRAKELLLFDDHNDVMVDLGVSRFDDFVMTSECKESLVRLTNFGQ